MKILFIEIFSWTSLHFASSRGHIEVVKVLLQNNANINSLNDKHQTPLQVAKNVGNILIVEYLLKNGAKIDIPRFCDSNNYNSRYFSVEKPDDPIDLLFKEIELDFKILLKSSKSGDILEFQKRSQNKYDMNNICKSEDTLLSVSSKYGHLHLVQYLITENSFITPDKLKIPLENAIKDGNFQICKYLIEKGAVISGIKYDDPLITAINAGDIRIIKMIIGYGIIDINSLSGFPLSYAAEIGRYKIVQLFIEECLNLKNNTTFV